jgi:hydrocephalus-inducing protein
VKKNEKFTIDLLFAPQDEFAFKSNASICLSIISGPTYTFILRGAAKTPGIDFSFYSYDFGPCFVLKQPLPITAELEIRNREATPISIESKYLKSDYLDVKIPSGQVVLPI